MRAGILTVGDELLAGDTVDTNATWLAERLTDRGVTVERISTVPDRTEAIAELVAEYSDRYDVVIVTGGLGPTHDDVTMDGVAAAFGRELRTDEQALEWLEADGYSRGDLATGTADLPEGSDPLHNEAGVAPGCILENVYVFPGVPDEMKAMFESVADRFAGTIRHVEHVTIDEAESALIERFAQLREQFGVKVGSYPGETVRVKIEHEDESVVREAAAWLEANAVVS
ncbi:competence/damage-inducible protein A [Halosegnis rubeus]|jgi:molybdenum cofactor synthesis domain-containing protein|uniref:Competence/damage-inducible protein A n=1 Tax=Halosegnis rubeus TaxID=2212850 RepID=A0A5N5UFS1_9EURY|nr:molybdopterin-binding protein [Halosegnis rubeus]KAB7513327.1 competence/damage-inducible protein A [Halosegnis rubeus]KAB7517310.1 competence/damage-inducible protein A [Halosegnis rubeus]KAB7518457.1 competence/damage-inducible protein A [Halosegnis rubeus]